MHFSYNNLFLTLCVLVASSNVLALPQGTVWAGSPQAPVTTVSTPNIVQPAEMGNVRSGSLQAPLTTVGTPIVSPAGSGDIRFALPQTQLNSVSTPIVSPTVVGDVRQAQGSIPAPITTVTTPVVQQPAPLSLSSTTSDFARQGTIPVTHVPLNTNDPARKQKTSSSSAPLSLPIVGGGLLNSK